MVTKIKKTELTHNEQINEVRGIRARTRIFIFTLAITAVLLLIPSWSKYAVFENGEFAYLESIGILLASLTFLLVFLYYLSNLIDKIKKQIIRQFALIGVIGITVFLLLFTILMTWIRFDVKVSCEQAKKEYGDTCVDALSKQLMDENQKYHSRNSAIWALGQLADKRALPVLNAYYTGIIPNRESLYKTISQYELRKAINWCEKGNSTSWMYKGF